MSFSIRYAVPIVTLALVTACAGAPKEPSQKERAPDVSSPPAAVQAPGEVSSQAPPAQTIGATSKEPGTAEISREKQITITEKTQIPSLKSSTTKADLNRVLPEHLVALGISDELARNIVAYRQQHGPFKQMNDLLSVDGMNSNIYRELSKKLGIG